MDHNLIDQLILALLRTPVDQRTPECITEALQRIVEAATPNELKQTGDLPGKSTSASIQQEQLKLAAVASFLKEELNYRNCSTQLSIDEYSSDHHQTLTILLSSHESSAESFLVGYGRTAEDALRDLHAVKKTRTELAA